jgi:hypothetical protein
MSIIKASSVRMHLVSEMYGDVTHMETVEVPDAFSDKTSIRHLMLGTGESSTKKELVHAFHENFADFRFEGTRYKGDGSIYTFGAMKYITNLRNHLTMNPERFMIRTVFALYPGLSRKGVWAIINGITNDRKHEDDKEADLATKKVQDNGSVVHADPGNTNIITIAAPKRGEDGTDGTLRQKDMCLLRFSRARYYRESVIMNARKKIDTWNAGMKDHLEALREVTSHGADFTASRKFMEVRVAHWDAL